MNMFTANLIAGMTFRDGGATFLHGVGNTWVKPNPTVHGRYAVGGFGETITVEADTETWRAVARIARWVETGDCVGTWVNDRGAVVVDHVRLFADREQALKAATENGEQAIYDLAAGETVTA